jgi:polyisoprenoid-binding protein YceI
MTTTVWTTIVALSSLGLAASTIDLPRPAAAAAGAFVAGGPPDTLVVDPRASSIRWKGTGLGGRGAREGTVNLMSGMFVIRHERLTSGTFTVDMRSMTVAGAPILAPASRRLGERLRAVDFFDVGRHPTTVFESTGATRVGQARWRVTGDLTMRGVTRGIAFEADVAWPETGHMVATSTFVIDRRQWGVANDVSGLAEDLVDDDIRISLVLDARRKQAKVASR